MDDVSPEKKSGCGLINAFFGKNKQRPKRSASTSSVPSLAAAGEGKGNGVSSNSSSRKRNNSDEGISDRPSNKTVEIQITSSQKIPHVGSMPQLHQLEQQKQQQGNLRKKNNFIVTTSQNTYNNNNRCNNNVTQGGSSPYNYNNNDNNRDRIMVVQGGKSIVTTNNKKPEQVGSGGKKVITKESIGLSGELESMIADHLKAKGGNSNLVRASSGNVMLYGHLGNLGRGVQQQPPTPASSIPNSNGNNNNNNTASARSSAAATTTTRYANSVMGNIVKKNNNQDDELNPLCRALSCRMDPEELKILGNEDYKNGRFAEALALYERAVDLDPSKAAYRSNKSAALAALGRLLEAVFECREAIKIEPQYHRAHLRLANLHLRLGEAEKAIHHFKHAGAEADPDVNTKAKAVLVHLRKCDEAKRLRDWNTVLKETGNAISAGADSAPMIYALRAESLMKLHRHQDADIALNEEGPTFEVEQLINFFGPAGTAILVLIRAQVDLGAGRFDEAITATNQAAQLDPANRELNTVTRRARAVSGSRTRGNDMFKSSRFTEACVAYGEGLEHDPYNSVLLCNRAACRSKLGQYEKAVDDCNAALSVRPSYTKARLRRADCNSKLEKWEAAVQDYEMLMRESPGDEEVGRCLFEAQLQLKKQRGEDVSGINFDDNKVVVVQSNDRFRHYVTLPGLCVALFCNKPGSRTTLLFMDQLCKRYLMIKFIKVEVEDHHSLIAKSEGVNSLPAFKVYRNGSPVKEVSGDNHQLLESTIKECCIS